MNYEALLKVYNSISKAKLGYESLSLGKIEKTEPLIRVVESNIGEILADYSKIKKVQELKRRLGIKQEKASIEAAKKLEERMKEAASRKEAEEKLAERKEEKKEEPEQPKKPEPWPAKEAEQPRAQLQINFSVNIIPPLEFSLNPEEKAEEHVKEILSKAKMKVDENDIKKKMFEYTKQLFKTKDSGERERIKAEIVALKNLLAGGATKTNLPSLLISHQNFEINSALNSIEKEFERNHSELMRQTKETLSRALSDSDVLGVKREFQNKEVSLFSELNKVAEASSNYFTVHHFNETRVAKERYNIDGALDAQETVIMRHKNAFGEFLASLKEKADERSRGMF